MTIPDASLTPAFTDDGFAVLRTPILPFDMLAEWARGRAAESGPAETDAVSAASSAWQDAILRDAVRVASPSLYAALERLLGAARDRDREHVALSLSKYFLRACYRPTPFGLFAGCSLIRFGDVTHLELSARERYRRHTRLGMDYLDALVERVLAAPDLWSQLRLRSNQTVAVIGQRIHYVRGTINGSAPRRYELTAVDATPEILRAIEAARCGATIDQLSLPLRSDGYTEDEIGAFISELLDSQVLVSELQLALTTSREGPAERLADDLEEARCAPELVRALRDVRTQLDAIDAAGVGFAPDYDAALSSLKNLGISHDLEPNVQVDLYKPAPSASLGRRVLHDVVRAVELLGEIGQRHDPLAEFAKRFTARYETREVALLEALDDEVGVGMPAAGVHPAADEPGATARRELVLANLRCRAAETGSQTVELTREDVADLRYAGDRQLPASVGFFGQLLASSSMAIDRGEYLLYTNGVMGPSGARLLGRFAHLDAELLAALRSHLRAEEELDENSIFAEVVHLPGGRVGNVVARPVLRRYEIPYLGCGGSAEHEQLDVADLAVRVTDGRVSMRSVSRDREVHPRLTTAHNFRHASNLPVYSFLCALQEHRTPGTFAWSWGAQHGAAFLPRVTYGRLILQRATWRVPRTECKELANAWAARDYSSIEAWRVRRRIPQRATLVEADNVLPIDFDDRSSVSVFIRLVRRLDSATVAEDLVAPESLCVRGPEGAYNHELIVPLTRAAPNGRATTAEAAAPKISPTPLPRTTRAFPPGSEWLYAKLYCGPANGDWVVRELLPDLLAEWNAVVDVRTWFFVRYADPEHHIRIRIKTSPEDVATLFGRLTRITNGAIASHRLSRVVFDTYQPEVERYGGALGIPISEALFCADSEAAISALARGARRVDSENRSADLIALASIDRLLSDVCFSKNDRVDLLERALGPLAASIRRERGMIFRARRAAVESILASSNSSATDVGCTYERRSVAARPLWAELRRLAAEGALTAPFEDIVLSHAHMSVNRLLPSGKSIEPILYDQLQRAYRSQRGREAVEGGVPRLHSMLDVNTSEFTLASVPGFGHDH